MTNVEPRSASASDPDNPLERRSTARPDPGQPELVGPGDQRGEALETRRSGGRNPDSGPDEEIRFDGQRASDRETESAAPAPTIATGMFMPVAIILIIAVVLIFVFVL